ncbi:MAG: hypothetical protein ACRENQ_03510 [Gemmatimonadaceae bacterium]
MTDADSEILSEDEAGSVWARAAELQAKAAGRVDAPDAQSSVMPAPGYSLAHVRAAAVEAGIAAEFVDAAMADVREKRGIPTVQHSTALARRFLKQPPSAITVRRVVGAAPREVLVAMQAVFPEAPYRLTFSDQQGDPLDGGLLAFDIQGSNAFVFQGFGFATRDAGLRKVLVSLRAIEESPDSCEVTLHSPVTSHNLGFALGTLVSTVGGGAGLAGGIGVGVAVGIAPLLPAIAAVGLLAGGGLGLKGYRALYARSMRNARAALQGLVGAVAARAEGVWRTG